MLKTRKNTIIAAAMPVLLFCFLFTGCQTAVPEKTVPHVIAADSSGGPAFFDCMDEKGKIIRTADSMTLEKHLAAMKSNMEKSGRKKIMIYCFGGMNSLTETLEVSAQNTDVIMRDSDVYPIFINWESELFNCYFNDLLVVRQGVVDYWLGPPLVPFVFLQHILTACARLPVNLVYQSGGLLDFHSKEMYESMSSLLQSKKMGFECYMGQDKSKHWLTPLIRTGYFAGLPLRIVSTGLIDAFGSRGWQEMRRRSKLCFVRDLNSNASLESKFETISSKPDGVLSHFAEMLLQYAKEHPDTEITFIGHCMGTFLVNEFLSRYPELPLKNIVFMAGASSVYETVSVVRPYLIRHKDAHFYNLTLHPWIDWYDMMDYCVLPCGSVLSWVNLHLTDPASPDDFTIGIWDVSISQLPRLMTGVEKQVTLKAFGINNPFCNVGADDLPHQHTDFSSVDSGFWKKEFWKPPEQKTVCPVK